jgi:phage shock protein PspC (stress-responsive transcriptional regulator)
MKKTFTINISGTIFHIEEDAYERLQGYFQRLKTHFGNGTEAREIIADIEGRVAEIFIEKTTGENKVVTLELIEEVITIMGSPEDFLEPDTEEPIPGITRRKRRLYRSTESKVIAGVCGGLGAYFNIDPVILRIIFVLLTFVNGVGLLAYIILWIAVPKAVTTAQRLEMRGEEATVSNIERSFRDQGTDEVPGAEAGQTTDSAGIGSTGKTRTYGKDYASRKKANDTSSDLGKLLLRVIAVVFGSFFIVTGFLGLIGLISTAIVGHSLVGTWPLAFSHDLQISNLMGHFVSPGALTLGIISLAVLVGIPFLALFFIGTKLVFSYKTNNAAIGLGMVGVWLVALITLLVVSAGEAGNYKSQTSLTNSETIYCEPCPTIYLEVANDPYAGFPASDWDLDRFKVVSEDGRNILLGQPRFDIEKSATDDVVLVFRKRSRGKDQEDANANIREIVFNYQLKDSVIRFDPWFMTGTEGKWRDQRVDITLKLPVGKSVYLSDDLVNILYDVENVSNTWDREMVGKYWEMKAEGLTVKSP